MTKVFVVHRTSNSWYGDIVNGVFSTLEKAQDYVLGEVIYNYSKNADNATKVAREILQIQNFIRTNRDLGWVEIEKQVKIKFPGKVVEFYYESGETDWFDADDDSDQYIVELCYSLRSYNIEECEIDNV